MKVICLIHKLIQEVK